MTRARISLTLELSWMFLSFHILFNLVMAAVACAVLARISSFEPSAEIIDPRYLKVDTVSSVWSLILISFWMPLELLVITLVLSAFISMPYFLEAVSKHSASASSSSSSPASPSMSSANRKLVMVLPPMMTVPWCFSRASAIMSSRNMLNRVGDKIHPCLTPMVARNQSPSVPFTSTALVAFSYKLCTTRMMSAVMLYLLMVAHSAAYQTRSKAFLKSMNMW